MAQISTDDRHVPRLVITLGLYGSASTWLFNVVRETLNAAYGAARVCAYYADAITLIFQDGAIPGRHVVVKAAIFSGYDTASVRNFAGRVSALPAERLDGGADDLFDRVTHIHRNHIGDGLTGKWRESLSASQSATITQAPGDFIARFGY